MKKTTVTILIIIAIPLYVYNILVLVGGLQKKSKENGKIHEEQSFSLDQLVLNATPVKFESNIGKNPFDLYKKKPVVQKKPTPVKKVKPKIKKEPPKPPSITITGIIWNPKSPVAMLSLPDGSSVVAKDGQEFGNVKIKKIEQNRVAVVSEGTVFWIKR